MVTAKVIQKGNTSYAAIGGKVVNIPSAESVISVELEAYAVPVKDKGVFRGYNYKSATTPPTYDSFKVTKLVERDGRTYYWFVGSAQEWNNLVNNGTAPTTIIPTVIPEVLICTDSNNAGSTLFSVPVLGTGQKYKFYLAKNGVRETGDNNANDPGVHTNGGAGFATVNSLVSYLNSNYSSYGTWSVLNAGNIKLTVSSGDVNVGLVVVAY